jgi:hypothetical protein
VTGEEPPIGRVIETIKRAIGASNKICSESDGGLRIRSAHLTLKVIAIRDPDSAVAIRVPSVDVGVKDLKLLTHTVDIGVVPPDAPDAEDFSSALVEGVNAVKAALAETDQFLVTGSTVTFSFAVDKNGEVLLGDNNDLSAAVTHSLALTLVPVVAC